MTEPTQIVALIGCITGIASLIGLIYAIGFKLGAVATKVETLWTIYVLHLKPLKSVDGKILRKQELISQGYVRIESPYMLTSKGEEILPEDLKIKIREIVRSKKFRKIAKKDSIEDVVPLMLDKVGMDRLGEVASKAEMNTANIAIVASLYALNRFKEKEEKNAKMDV